MAIDRISEAPAVRISFKSQLFLAVIGFVLICSVPFVAPSRFYIGLSLEIVLFGLWAVSLNLLIGVSGLVSFGHAAFFGLGAYGTGLLVSKLGWSFIPALTGGVLLAGFAAAIAGVVIVRLSGIAFALLTMAFAMVVYTTIWRLDITGGDDGLMVRRPLLSIFSWEIPVQNNTIFYLLTIFMVSIVCVLLYRFVNSPVGANLQAIRQNADRANSIGINVKRHKLAAFIIAGSIAGLSGSLYVLFRGFASPELLHWSSSGHVLMMAVLGGTSMLFGGFLGAAAFVILHEVLSQYTQHWMLPLGILFILAVLFLKGEGLGALLRGVQRK